MSPQAYLYAFYIFVLVGLLIVLYRFLGAPQRRSRADQDARDQADHARQERLFKLYQNIEDMMDNFEGYLEQSREQMQSDRAQMEEQIAQVRALCERAEAVGGRLDRAVHRENEQQMPATVTEGQRRNQVVRTMLDQGMTTEEIARAMDVSINEIKLIAYGLARKTS